MATPCALRCCRSVVACAPAKTGSRSPSTSRRVHVLPDADRRRPFGAAIVTAHGRISAIRFDRVPARLLSAGIRGARRRRRSGSSDFRSPGACSRRPRRASSTSVRAARRWARSRMGGRGDGARRRRARRHRHRRHQALERPAMTNLRSRLPSRARAALRRATRARCLAVEAVSADRRGGAPARDGDTVIVHAGVYREPLVVVDKPLAIVGQGRAHHRRGGEARPHPHHRGRRHRARARPCATSARASSRIARRFA